MNTTERADILISHVVDGEATAEHWRELETLATGAPQVWRDLAAAQRDAAALRDAMRVGGNIAECVSIPDSVSSNERDVEVRTFAHPNLRLNRFGAWTGWLVAALITLVASIQIAQQNGRNAPTPVTGGFAGAPGAGLVQSAADAFNTYLQKGAEEGSVLGEVPGKMVVESRPVRTGQGFEVIFVRQVVERAIVPDLYQIDGVDERGQPTLARYRQPSQKKAL